MRIPAVITAAGPHQRHLMHQTLAGEGARLETVAQFTLNLLAPEGREAIVDRVAIVIAQGDGARFQDLLDQRRQSITLIEQREPLGYAQAIAQTRDFTGNGPFLHIVGDHFYLANEGPAWGLTEKLLEVYNREGVSVSALQPTRESLLPYFGAVGGAPQGTVGGMPVYRIDTVIEKPTPTEAEQRLYVPGMRAGHYLCFFGMHVFTPGLFTVLDEGHGDRNLSVALQELAKRESLLGTVLPGNRFDLGARYGILQAQLALGLKGPDREEILAMLVELMAR